MSEFFSRPLAKFMAIFAVVLGFSAVAMAQSPRSVEVKFPRGQSGTTISDRITGYQSVNYRLGVTAGQTMSVQLDTDNASGYFNITAPGASQAVYNGSISGNSTSLRIQSSGNYVINVYLMRNAARRSETANYQLTLYVEGRAVAVSPTPVQPDFADGLAGGPDYWQVRGLAGDTLNVRSGPGANNRILGRLAEGDVLRNRGCQMNGSTRWCQIETRRGLRGWVVGRYLRESSGNAQQQPQRPPRPTTLPSPFPTVLPSQGPRPTPYDAVSTADMPRYCAGEASAEFGVRPTEITTNLAFKSGDNYVVQGNFDGDNGTTFFNCYFGLDGSFSSVS
ncbi:hypothetical protein ABIB57_003080 [Devosia sp. UYZn731]|uniref:SH3 domain-containing protein n=1 Tax=Devosia sp. UYZn731 TaxID=3156345 RepID=UPI003397F1ED